MPIVGIFIFLLSSLIVQAAPAGAQSAMAMDWEGRINNKIHFTMCTDLDDSESGLVMGELRYAGGSGKIMLLGSWQDDRLYLQEMLPDGTISGLISGQLQDDLLTGHWSAPDQISEKDGVFSFKSGKRYSLEARQLKRGCETESLWLFDPAQVAGTYQYSFGQYNACATLKVRDDGHGQLSFQIYSVTAAPAFNLAAVPGDGLEGESWAQGRLEGNKLHYEVDESCAFTISFFRNFASIEYLGERACGGMFGLGAGVAGYFVKLEQ